MTIVQRFLQTDGTTDTYELVNTANDQVVGTVTQPAPDPAVVTAQNNERTLRDRIDQALNTNATYLALGAPTNAQNLAQIRALTRQVNGLMRLESKKLDSINDS